MYVGAEPARGSIYKVVIPEEKMDSIVQNVPVPTGPQQVGSIKYDLIDPYRKDLKFPEGRLIPIQIYFPLEQGEHVAYPKVFEERASLGPFKPLNYKGL